MIRELEIKNFRSIQHDRISLEPLTVLIGANGSGKSNLVKTLEFIADLPNAGVHLAVSRQGGREGMVPKNIPLRDIKKKRTYIKYIACLVTPDIDENHPDPVNVEHEFEIEFRSNSQIKITHEKLTFHDVIYVGKVFRERNKKSKNVSPNGIDSNSSFSLSREGGSPRFEANPKFSDINLPDYIYWLGLDAVQEKISKAEELEDFLKTFRSGRSRRLSGSGRELPNTSNGLFTDPLMPTIFDFAPQAQFFLATISSIKRYDLLLHELRGEQAPSNSSELSKSGKNLPAALRRLKLKKDSYKRLKASFESIAPHISDMRSASLRTGNEFIEFIESKSGRGIESWQSSDGSLRALAILIALETADKDDLIIIEEPEQNLHPWAIRTLIDHMREIVDKNRVQIILTTHSEHVLERIHPKEVRVVSRDGRQGTKFQRIDQIIPKKEIGMGEVGRLWVKGMLGGVPAL